MAKPKREPKLPMVANLPATVEEADALLFARDLIARLGGAGDVGSPFEAAESRHVLRKFLGGALQTTQGRLWLVKQAQNGEEESQIILREALLEMESRHVEPPKELGFYRMLLVSGDIAPPLRWAGPKKKNEITRNICVAMVVAGVVGRFGLKPTGRSARRRSACSIVAEALEAIRMRLGYEAVKSIWATYGHLMPTERGFWNSLYT